MSVETKKVLEMLAAGKISPEDAERLLDKLTGAAAQGDASKSQANPAADAPAGGAAQAKRPHFLHIKVERPDGRDTDVRVPLSAVRCGRHWTAFLPLRVADKLSEYGIDLGSLDAMNEQEFQAAIERMNVRIQSHNGKNVYIYAE
jgi:SHOCT-like protein